MYCIYRENPSGLQQVTDKVQLKTQRRIYLDASKNGKRHTFNGKGDCFD